MIGAAARGPAAIGLIAIGLAASCGGQPPLTGPEAPAPASSGIHPSLVERAALFERAVLNPAEGIYVAVGYALSNVILIEGDDGVIIVDTTEGRAAAEEAWSALRRFVDKPVAAVVLTHDHADHIYGGEVFTGGDPAIPVYAHAQTEAGIDRIVSELQGALVVRGRRMFGALLPEGDPGAELGLRLRFAPDQIALARPTHTFTDRLAVEIAGVQLELAHAPGETDDQIYVWLPERRALLPADNIYQAFPNLSSIRGARYRDARRWVQSLDAMRALEPEVLVPQHTHPISGAAEVASVLTAYRDAIQYVHDQTVRGINAGRTPDELAASIALPPHLASHPWLQEHYGRVSWSVRGIYSGYVGWFDGDSAALEPLPPDERARRYAAAFAAGSPLPEQVRAALDAGEHAWAAELARHWQRAEPDQGAPREALAEALEGLAWGHVNPNARSWYLTEALELRGEVDPAAPPDTQAPLSFIDGLPLAPLMTAMATRLRAEEVLDVDMVASFEFTDVGETWSVHVRRGVAEIHRRPVEAPDLKVTTTALLWRRLVAGRASRAAALASGELAIEGGAGRFARFISWFRADD